MKKMLMNFVLGLALISSAAYTPKAHAYLLIEGASGSTPADGPWHDGIIVAASYTVLCLIVLPLCLLDEEGNGQYATTASHLAANGYSQEEINQIIADQASTVVGLKSHRASLKIMSFDTRESIAKDLRTVNPSVSDTYINFISESAGL
ncbi:MAG: hypothetical protein ACJ76H_01645 [Bacteriovoracaceae bacterium]